LKIWGSGVKMIKSFSWSHWSISTKILIAFLALAVISQIVFVFIAVVNIQDLSEYASKSSTALGQSAIKDSTSHLNKLGEETISQIAVSVAKQVEIYLENKPPMSIEQMRNDRRLREIVVQPVGATGYTTLLDSKNFVIVIHKYLEQEKSLSTLKDALPSFWDVLTTSAGGKASAGYYDWQEVDGSIRQKYASIVPIKTGDGDGLTLWATTYIDEFSRPAAETAKEINAAIAYSDNYISGIAARMQNTFIITFAILVCIVILLALIFSRVITSPILALKHGAEQIGSGKLDYKLNVQSRDELGDLARSFNKMGSDLKNYTEELKKTASEKIAKEKEIQDHLRLYVQKVSQAQEAERKRVARELHDETAQDLVVVLRHLDDFGTNNAKLQIKDIRNEVKRILEGVRHLCQELRPSILDDLGLIPAVKWLASDLSKNFGISAEVQTVGNPRPLVPETELVMFRITQEALANVRKHSQATKVNVRIEFEENKVIVSIRDNGKGFISTSDIDDLARKGKLGLVGIQERVQLLRGDLKINSQQGRGTELLVEVPT
jgi:signal transduction histidine kinase